MADEKWYFSKEQLGNTPSRRCGYDMDKELSYRQQAANFIQDMGQRLLVTQLCINTAIVYMHRFYVFHSFTHFHRNAMAAASLFLAAKVEEQPRKLEHVIKVAHICLHRDHQQQLDTKSEQYLEQAHELVFNENVLLQTLGFDVAIDHPHTHVVRCCHMVRASKDLAQTSYFMASNSLHLTTMCLQYKPTVVACFCIHLACKWSNWEIPQSNEGKDWFWYVDKTVSLDQLEQLTAEFLVIFDKCPTKLKRKIMSISASQTAPVPQSTGGCLFDTEPRKVKPPEGSIASADSLVFHQLGQADFKQVFNLPKEDTKTSAAHLATLPANANKHDFLQAPPNWEHREKRERDRDRDREKSAMSASRDIPHHHHHHHHTNSGGSLQTTSLQGIPLPPTPMPPLPMSAPVPPLPIPPSNGHHHNKSNTNQVLSSQSHQQKQTSARNDISVRQPVNSAREAARREQTHIKETTKRDVAIRAGNDHKFVQPSRHEIMEARASNTSVPQEVQLQSGSGLKIYPGYVDVKESVVRGNEVEDARMPASESKSQGGSSFFLSISKDGVKCNPPESKLMQSEHSKHSQATDSLRQRSTNDHKNIQGAGETRVKELTRVCSSSEGDMWQYGQSDTNVDQHKHMSHKYSMSDNKQRRSAFTETHISSSDIPDRRGDSRNSSDILKPTVIASLSAKNEGRVEIKSERKPEVVPDVKYERPEKVEIKQEQLSNKDDNDIGSTVSSKNPSMKFQQNSSSHSSEKSSQKSHHRSSTSHSSREKSLSGQVQGHSHITSSSPSKSQKSLLKSKVQSSSSKAEQHVPSISVSISRAEISSSQLSVGKNEQFSVNGHPVIVPNEAKKKKPEKEVSPSKSLHVEHESENAKKSPSNLSASNKLLTGSSQKTEKTITPTRELPHTSRPGKSKQRAPSSSRKSTLQTTDHAQSQFESTPLPAPSTPGKTLSSGSSNQSHSRNRTSSSSSEPELVPVVKKLDEIAGYENIIKDARLGIRIPGKVSDVTQTGREKKKEDTGLKISSKTSTSKEVKAQNIVRQLANQIPETQKSAITSDLGAIAFPSPAAESGSGFSGTLIHDLNINNNPMIDVVTLIDVPYEKTVTLSSEGNHVTTPVMIEAADAEESAKRPAEYHRSDKKKKKDKHKHKEKRDEKRHKSKHKSKDKERYKEDQPEPVCVVTEPIRITIPKGKIQTSVLEPPSSSSGSELKLKLGQKLKIARDQLKKQDAPNESPQPTQSTTPLKVKIPQAAPSGPLKIKISCSSDSGNSSSSTTPVKDSRKREWTASSKSEMINQPPHKTARVVAPDSSKKSSGSKHNGAELRSSRGPHSTKGMPKSVITSGMHHIKGDTTPDNEEQ